MRRTSRRSMVARIYFAILLLGWTASANADTSTTWIPTGNPPSARFAAADGLDSTDTELLELIERVNTILGPMLTGERRYDPAGPLAFEALANAVRQQGQRALPSLITAVEELLKATKYPLAARFMVLIGNLGGDKASNFLKDLGANFGNGWIRTAAIRSYALTRDKDVAKLITKALETDEGIVDRNGLIYDLGKNRDPAAVPFLTDLLYRGSISERAFAATALGDVGNVAALGPLKRLIIEERIAPVRANAILAIGNIGGRDSIDYLARLIGVGRDPKEELAAVAAIGLSGGPDAIDALLKVLRKAGVSPAARVRAEEELTKLKREASTRGEQ